MRRFLLVLWISLANLLQVKSESGEIQKFLKEFNHRYETDQVNRRSDDGHQSEVSDLEDIYDYFNFMEPTPDAFAAAAGKSDDSSTRSNSKRIAEMAEKVIAEIMSHGADVVDQSLYKKRADLADEDLGQKRHGLLYSDQFYAPSNSNEVTLSNETHPDSGGDSEAADKVPPQDNVVAANPWREVVAFGKKAEGPAAGKRPGPDPSFDLAKIQKRLIPSDLKTVIEDNNGRKIVKTVLLPAAQEGFKADEYLRQVVLGPDERKDESHPEPSRIISAEIIQSILAPDSFSSVKKIFDPRLVTIQIISSWVTAISSTLSWLILGTVNNMMLSRIKDLESGRAAPELWEDLVPDSETVASVLRSIAGIAERWHDEL